jgi:hypothetical protein
MFVDIYTIEQNLIDNITSEQAYILARIKMLEDLSRDINWRKKQLRQELNEVARIGRKKQ